MPWDGGGNFNREHDWTDDANADIDIEASRMDEEDDNFATGIEACLNKDGQNTAEQINVDNLRLDGNDLTSQNTNGGINITPNGTGPAVIKNRVDIIPVSTTTSGGTAGIDYDVADWPDTLVSGRTYYARAHTDSIGSYSIDPGGGAITALRPDGTATQPLDWPKDTIMGFRYDGSNLIQAFVHRFQQLTTLTGVSSTSMARFCRVTVTGQPAYCMIDVRAKYDLDPPGVRTNYTLTVTQTSAFESSPGVSIYAYDHQNNSVIDVLAHTSVIAVITTSASDSVVDFYIRRGDSSSGLSKNIDIDINSITSESDIQVEFFSNETLASPTPDVTSQASVGEVVAEESFSLGGDFTGTTTAYAKKVRGIGGSWVEVWVAQSMSHSSDSSPDSASGALPATYRPSITREGMYLVQAGDQYKWSVNTSGTITTIYRDAIDTTLSAETSTGDEFTMKYFVPDT